MERSFSSTVLAGAVLVAFVAGMAFGGRDGEGVGLFANTAATPPENVDLQPLWHAWQLLDDRFVPASSTMETAPEDRLWGLIGGLADSYDDPYTLFLPPQQNKNFTEEIRGTFGGVGIEMGVRDGILTVIAPLKGTPADTAGIMAGDLILEVDGDPTAEMTIDDAIEHIRGEIGTTVVLTVAREGEQELLEIPIIRDTIEVPTLDTELYDDVFYIALYNFGGTATGEMRDALRAFLSSDRDKLIVDLRGNPGGYLEAAVDVASWFLPLGTPVVIEDYGPDKEQRIHRSKGHEIIEEDWKIVVLIDGGSASASEILAGALSEHGIATLMGTQTFGKGSVQELIEVTPETALKITIARWLTPLGHSISENGLVPHHEVEYTATDAENDEDPQLDAALVFLRTGNVPAPQNEEALEETAEVE